jgi:signal transduction histidine kinase
VQTTRPLSRLRWQLTLSHLIAIAFTLVSMIAALLLISSAWLTRNTSPAAQPADDARIVASAIQGLVVRDLQGSAPVDLSGVLQLITSGDVRVLNGAPAGAPEPARRFSPLGSSLANVAYLVVVGSDGRTLGSSDPAGAAFSPNEQREWQAPLAAALAGQRDPARLVIVRSGTGPSALGAYPITDDNGRVIAAALVASTDLPAVVGGFTDFWRALLFFGAATVAVLAGAFLFALAASSVLGYFLARRLVVRLERLGRAAEALASGDLSRRVDVADSGSADEVGQLARRFNNMADQLSETLAALASAKQRAEDALRTKRELVANVSHELRTPLASIRGHTESLQLRDPNLDGVTRARYLEIIQRQTEQLSHLIDDLFELSTAEAGGLPLALAPMAIGDVADEVASSIRSVAQGERKVTVLTDVEPNLPLVLADRQRVAQVVANLVRNAVRHTPEGGLVAIRAARRDPHAVIVSVEDTGVGIPADRLPHVFARFYRGDDSRDRASGGAGLGLAIVRELVEAMGGEVSAESIVGQGSRFSFSLPLATTSANDAVAVGLGSTRQ